MWFRVFLAASFVSFGCSVADGARCGAGTELVDGICRVVVSDAGGDAAFDQGLDAQRSDVQMVDATNERTGRDVQMSEREEVDGAIPEFVERVVLGTQDGTSGRTDTTIPIDMPVRFSLYSVDSVGVTTRIPLAAFAVQIAPERSTVRFERDARTLVVTASEATEFQLTLSATAANGLPLTASIRVRAVQPSNVRCATVAWQDGPWFSDFDWSTHNSNEEQAALYSVLRSALENNRWAQATAPVGGGIRLFSGLDYTLAYTQNGSPTTLRVISLRDADAFEYSVDRGELRAPDVVVDDAAGTVVVRGQYTRPSGAVLSSTVDVQFVPASAVRGLSFMEGGMPIRYRGVEDPAVQSFATGTLSRISFLNGTIPDALLSKTRLSQRRNGIVAVHGTGAARYEEWLPWSDVVLETMTGANVFSVTPNALQAAEPGIAVFIARTRGFELGNLVMTPFGSGTTLRVEPTTLVLPSLQSVAMPTSTAWVSNGVTHTMNELELLALSWRARTLSNGIPAFGNGWGSLRYESPAEGSVTVDVTVNLVSTPVQIAFGS